MLTKGRSLIGMGILPLGMPAGRGPDDLQLASGRPGRDRRRARSAHAAQPDPGTAASRGPRRAFDATAAVETQFEVELLAPAA